MKNHKVVFSFLLIILFTQITVSQNNNRNSRSNKRFISEESIENPLTKIQEKLSLDDLQMIVVKNILLKYNDKKRLLRNQYGNSQLIIAEYNNLNLQQDEELSKVLTEKQIATLHDFQKEQREEGERQAINKRRNNNNNKNRIGNRRSRRRY